MEVDKYKLDNLLKPNEEYFDLVELQHQEFVNDIFELYMHLNVSFVDIDHKQLYLNLDDYQLLLIVLDYLIEYLLDMLYNLIL
jgi:hypothetical protein